MMAVLNVGYDLQDGPKDAQNCHDGQGQRYGHLCVTAKQEKPPTQVGLEMFPHHTSASTALGGHSQSYRFLGGVVLRYNVQDPTDDELQEEMRKMLETTA